MLLRKPNKLKAEARNMIFYFAIGLMRSCDVSPENSLDDRNGKTKTNNTENNKD